MESADRFVSELVDWSWLENDLDRRRENDLYRERRQLLSGQGSHVRSQDGTLINFASNDYLNLASDPRLARAASEAARQFGTGAGASPLITGHLLPLRKLELDLAQWEGTASALVFSSGFVTNVALLSTLATEEDAIYSDALNHASLIEGCRLSKARTLVYDHLDLDQLRVHLDSSAHSARCRWIVTDSVFSMDGDIIDLGSLLELANEYDCFVILDEAHGTGVIGEQGRGVTDLYPEVMAELGERVIKVGTLSKALGAQGGFVCGPQCLIESLINFARPYVFSTALAPPIAAAASEAISIVQSEPERRTDLQRRADFVRAQLQDQGWSVGPSQCHIIPVIVESSTVALSIASSLEKQGLLVPAIRPPSVPEGTARLRISLSAGHREEDLQRLLDGLRSTL